MRTSDSIDPTTRTLLVEVDVENRDHRLMPGAYAQVRLTLNTGVSTLIVPVPTMIFQAQGLQVAVVENGRAKLVPITIGQDDGRVIQVVRGLTDDAEVIQNPPDSLVDGEPVHVVQPGQTDENASPGAANGSSNPQEGAQQQTGSSQAGSQANNAANSAGGAGGGKGGKQ